MFFLSTTVASRHVCSSAIVSVSGPCHLVLAWFDHVAKAHMLRIREALLLKPGASHIGSQSPGTLLELLELLATAGEVVCTLRCYVVAD